MHLSDLLYTGLLRPLLFRMDAERAHAVALRAAALGGGGLIRRALVRAAVGAPPERPVEVMGLRFPNPVGLAAGFDKDGRAWRGLAAMGFGHVEVGTVTPRPQAGNPKPRVFRLPEDQGVINRLGFPGEGAEAVLSRLSHERPHGAVLGVNLGKNKATPNEEALGDYTALIERFAPLADYLAINVSSPNTEGLRDLQARDALADLLTGAVAARDVSTKTAGHPRRPLVVKISPDLSDVQLDDALDAALAAGVDGIIATNTTISRDGLRSARASEGGGLSGAPLTARSQASLEAIIRRLDGALPVIAVGGIMCADDAKARLDAGASLVQLYTGLIYAGPGLARQIVASL